MSDKIIVFTTVTMILKLRPCKPKSYLFILLRINVRIPDMCIFIPYILFINH